LGSSHCAAMCGGIATALGTSPGGRGRVFLYQIGRISSYAIAGACVGALGAAAGFAFAISRWSEVLRLATAVMVIVIGLDIALSGAGRARWLRAPERLGAHLWRHMAPLARGTRHAPPALRALGVGFLWGWLPCGLVYSVLLAAAVSGGALSGTATMAAFGLGTVPAMAGFALLGTRLPRPEGALARVLGAVLVACGLWTAAVPVASLTGSAPHHHHGSAANLE
ncbi:MAG TPA: sulfite exporter TauE/SafE family protein, partial [Steroidobacteraceae bacterium]|nr:sulfite exporter TauE/SafE family protein [Steroidobacteraceae bacterium]